MTPHSFRIESIRYITSFPVFLAVSLGVLLALPLGVKASDEVAPVKVSSRDYYVVSLYNPNGFPLALQVHNRRGETVRELSLPTGSTGFAVNDLRWGRTYTYRISEEVLQQVQNNQLQELAERQAKLDAILDEYYKAQTELSEWRKRLLLDRIRRRAILMVAGTVALSGASKLKLEATEQAYAQADFIDPDDGTPYSCKHENLLSPDEVELYTHQLGSYLCREVQTILDGELLTVGTIVAVIWEFKRSRSEREEDAARIKAIEDRFGNSINRAEEALRSTQRKVDATAQALQYSDTALYPLEISRSDRGRRRYSPHLLTSVGVSALDLFWGPNWDQAFPYLPRSLHADLNLALTPEFSFVKPRDFLHRSSKTNWRIYLDGSANIDWRHLNSELSYQIGGEPLEEAARYRMWIPGYRFGLTLLGHSNNQIFDVGLGVRLYQDIHFGKGTRHAYTLGTPYDFAEPLEHLLTYPSVKFGMGKLRPELKKAYKTGFDMGWYSRVGIEMSHLPELLPTGELTFAYNQAAVPAPSHRLPRTQVVISYGLFL